jgi:hypothetical protein
LKNPITKNWAVGVAHGEGSEFKPCTARKKVINKIFKQKKSQSLNGHVISSHWLQ